jgi:hypothetical protein
MALDPNAALEYLEGTDEEMTQRRVKADARKLTVFIIVLESGSKFVIIINRERWISVSGWMA